VSSSEQLAVNDSTHEVFHVISGPGRWNTSRVTQRQRHAVALLRIVRGLWPVRVVRVCVWSEGVYVCVCVCVCVCVWVVCVVWYVCVCVCRCVCVCVWCVCWEGGGRRDIVRRSEVSVDVGSSSYSISEASGVVLFAIEDLESL